MRPEDTMTFRVGEENINYQGIKMRIVAYRKSNDIDVLFLNGHNEIVKTRYEHFRSGKVRSYTHIIGERITNARGFQFEVIAVSGHNKVIIKYDTGEVREVLREKLHVSIPDPYTTYPLEDKYEIVGHKGYYLDKEGNVYNSRGMKLQPQPQSSYLGVDLPREGKRAKRFPIHRLMAQTFLPNPENKPQVNHKDGNKYNNRLENLEWATRSENMKHAYTVLGLHHRGERNTRAKLNNAQVLDIYAQGKMGISFRELANRFKVSATTVYYIVTGRSWRHLTMNLSV